MKHNLVDRFNISLNCSHFIFILRNFLSVLFRVKAMTAVRSESSTSSMVLATSDGRIMFYRFDVMVREMLASLLRRSFPARTIMKVSLSFIFNEI